MKTRIRNQIILYYSIVIYLSRTITKIRYIYNENLGEKKIINLWPNRPKTHKFLRNNNFLWKNGHLDIYETKQVNISSPIDKSEWEVIRDYFQIKILRLIVNSDIHFIFEYIPPMDSFLSLKIKKSYSLSDTNILTQFSDIPGFWSIRSPALNLKIKFPNTHLNLILPEVKKRKKDFKIKIISRNFNNSMKFSVKPCDFNSFEQFKGNLNHNIRHLMNDKELIRSLSQSPSILSRIIRDLSSNR